MSGKRHCKACGGSGSRLTDRNGQPAMELRCTVCGGTGRKPDELLAALPQEQTGEVR